MKGKSPFWITIILMLFLGILPAITKASPATEINITPATNLYDTGEVFTIYIGVKDVTNLNAWQVDLRFDNQMLDPYPPNSSSIEEGAFLKTAGSTSFTGNIGPSLDYITAGCSLTGPGGASGSGILATVTFEVKDTGECTLHLYNTLLYDENLNSISHTTVDASFATTSPRADFDYSPDLPNKTETVTFNASASYAPGGGEITSYNWDFGDDFGDTGMIVTHAYTEAGVYVITLTVTEMPPEYPGDANHDGTVNWQDLFTLAASYGSYPGHDRWNPDCDFNDDDTVNWQDLFTLAAYYGKERIPRADSVQKTITIFDP